MIKIQKIIAGGQTGVDRGALEAARDFGMDIGGWCPPGRKAEDGRIPDDLPLRETPVECSKTAIDIPSSLRTEWNVRDSDATLIISPGLKNKTDIGTEWTKSCCVKINKPFLIYDILKEYNLSFIIAWLKSVKPKILNIAGPSENVSSGIQHKTRLMVTKLLLLMKQNETSGDDLM